MTHTANDAQPAAAATEALNTFHKYVKLLGTALVVILAVALVAGAAIGLTSGIRHQLVEVPAIGPLGYTGSVFLLLDLTESEERLVRQRVCAVAKSRVIGSLKPGMYSAGYAIGPGPGYDEVSGRIFGDRDAPGPRVRLEMPDESLRTSALKAEIAGQEATLHDLGLQWSRAIDDVRPPRNRCCSAYLAALSYLERRLRDGSLPAPVTVVIIGDLLEEPIPEPFAPPSAEGPDHRVYAGVRVLLVRPFAAKGKHSRSQIDGYWADYFQHRGANAQIYDLNGFPGFEAQ